MELGWEAQADQALAEPPASAMRGNDMADTLYARLGGYDAIAAVADDLLAR